VVVVLALVELEDRLAGLEVAARQQPGLLELHQHAVDRGQADVGAFGEQRLEHILGRHVATLGACWKTSRILRRGRVAFRPLS
jgi:hypothetical protein